MNGLIDDLRELWSGEMGRLRGELDACEQHVKILRERVAELEGNHCVDCCCARSWDALGVVKYTGQSIPDHIAELRAERAALKRENDWMRAYTGNSDKACVYCGLGATEQGQCDRGFPGCARADDQLLCPEAGVAMERDALRADAERYRWLRDTAPVGIGDMAEIRGSHTTAAIDAAIDAAKEPQT